MFPDFLIREKWVEKYVCRMLDLDPNWASRSLKILYFCDEREVARISSSGLIRALCGDTLALFSSSLPAPVTGGWRLGGLVSVSCRTGSGSGLGSGPGLALSRDAARLFSVGGKYHRNPPHTFLWVFSAEINCWWCFVITETLWDRIPVLGAGLSVLCWC